MSLHYVLKKLWADRWWVVWSLLVYGIVMASGLARAIADYVGDQL